MKIEMTFLRSKVARRIFVLFICCALIPIGALAALSYTQVTKQLNEHSQRRLHHASKAVGMAIFERLQFLEDEMQLAASKCSEQPSHSFRNSPEEFDGHLKERFKGLAILAFMGKKTLLFGHIQNMPNFTQEQKQHIRAGGTLISSERYPDLTPHIFMAVALDSKNQRHGILVGEINPAYLWFASVENPLLPSTELFILDQSKSVLFSSLPGVVSFSEQVMLQMSRSALGRFEWMHGEKEYLANYWSMFLQGPFFTPKWTVVLSESKSDVLAPAANFKKVFPPIILMSLLVVLLLSTIQIQRSLIPLEKLREGTMRIGQQDFNSQVTIKSGDEFEELAGSFNKMTSRLGKQFNTLTTMHKIDRAILSALDTRKIIEVVLTCMYDISPCDTVSVTLLDFNAEITGQTYIGNGKGKGRTSEAIILKPEEMEILSNHPGSLLVESGIGTPNYLAPMVRSGIKKFLVLPIILKQRLLGFITLGWYLQSAICTQEDFDRARQLADQMGVALSNASLIRELNELNWGTLTALARAIDAKSPWTAGHSERVTKLALRIGQVLGLTQEEMDVLHRGGLLHDIGKLGIPGNILDKPGKLTKEEEELMHEHVHLGVRILEPIAAYAEIIPIVLHHHEYFNGEGYPDGLAAEAISMGARIFAVVDSFDALTSDRPYRRALERKYAIEMIKQGAGNRYDPDIVQFFLKVMAQEMREGEA
ncbi:MAG: HD domain-containing phosphohydrolase [Thermodesulfobacteriota bacterium]|jgi:putative nucleotidyltransferase with HDIG domain